MEKYKLTENVRASRTRQPGSKRFAAQLLKIGNDTVPKDLLGGLMTFPPNFGIFVDDIDALVAAVYPNLRVNWLNPEWLSGRTILATHNAGVDDINKKVMRNMPGRETV